ncbi:MAG TPA: M50 family metallopeptidase [Candidatus Babeliales bacterium]|jgi:regulator of sigma E protease|nr:M50 family metallopeptidase [Candidatus Babeliales bacterium]
MNRTKQNSTLKNLLYILGGLGGISLIIIIHEAGHFLFAKLFSVSTPSFSLGFGPTLFALSIGQTVFKIALLPFGGYVEMDPASFAQLSYIPKMLIIFAGILFNLIFAYAILLYYTLRNQTVLTPTISTVAPHSPADQAGLQPGDIIIACNHQPIGSNADLIATTVTAAAGTTLLLTITRNDITEDIPINLHTEHPLFGPHAGWLGIELEKKTIKRPSLATSLKKGHTQCVTTLQEMSYTVSKLMKSNTSNDSNNQQSMIMGPIGIISMIGKSLAINPQLYWFILAILSLNMGLFNILPLPFFDGGQAFIVTIETLTGKTIPATALWIVSTALLALFILFIARVTMNDIKQLIGRK